MTKRQKKMFKAKAHMAVMMGYPLKCRSSRERGLAAQVGNEEKRRCVKLHPSPEYLRTL